MARTKPLLHQVFAQNALTAESIKNGKHDIFVVYPQGKTSLIRKFQTQRIATRTADKVSVMCFEYDSVDDNTPNTETEIVISVIDGDIKLAFYEESQARAYLNWLKTSAEEKARIKLS